jgi:hypothetical protein
VNIDTAASHFCLAGLVRGTDASVSPPRRVRFEYRSDGSVQKANSNRVTGDFASVDLTLVIEESGVPVYEAGVTSACTLKGGINKAGERGKGRLNCKLGDGMSDLGLERPENSEFRSNVETAFPKQKRIKVQVDKGRLRVKHNGEPNPGPADPALDCSTDS